jgi:hypothetical protein
MALNTRTASAVTFVILATMGLDCGGGHDKGACNKLDVLDHPNAVVRFREGTFAQGTTEEVDRAANPLRTVDFRVADSQFAPDPSGPKGQLAAYVRFSDKATATDLTGFLDNARRQGAVIEAKPGDCPLQRA